MPALASAAPPASRRLLAGLLLTVGLHATHGLACATAMPAISADLGGRAWYGLFFSSYLLASMLGIVWGGVAVDRRGLRATFAWGLAAFAAGLVASGLAPSAAFLAASRALEGLGGGIATTVGYAAVGLAFAERERPRVLALRSAAWVLPALFAPPLAGVVAESFGWRWIFLALLPAVACAGALALPSLGALPHPVPPAADGGAADRARPLRDAVRLAAAAGLLLAGLGRASAAAWVAAVVGALAAAAPARRLLGGGSLRGAPGLTPVLGGKLLLSLAFFGVDAFLPLAMVQVQGAGAFAVGLVLTLAALFWTAGAALAARGTRSLAAARLVQLGLAALLAGLAGSAAVLAVGAPLASVAAAWAVAGLGIGVAYTAIDHAGVSLAPAGREGAASSALGIADSLGSSLGAGLGGALLAAGGRAGWAVAPSLAGLWWLAGAACLVALAVAHRIPELRQAAPEPQAYPRSSSDRNALATLGSN